MTGRTIPFVVDWGPQLPDGGEKHARSGFEQLLANQGHRILNLELSVISTDIAQRINELSESLADIDTSNNEYVCDSVSFTLAITASGEVAILSALKGDVSPQAGLQFTLKRRVVASEDQ